MIIDPRWEPKVLGAPVAHRSLSRQAMAPLVLCPTAARAQLITPNLMHVSRLLRRREIRDMHATLRHRIGLEEAKVLVGLFVVQLVFFIPIGAIEQDEIL